MSVYGNERIGKRASNECIAYYLNKYRDQLMKRDNERRRQLKAGVIKMSTYYIERNIVDDNLWRMVAIETDKQLAIELMLKLHNENPRSSYRIVEYIDSAHASMRVLTC